MAQRVNSRNKIGGGVFEATETGVLREDVMNSRKTVPGAILFFDTNFVH